MHYIKINSGTTIIEFSNSFSGKETIVVNGQIRSEKSSIMGTNHHFTIIENGDDVRYTLRTKIGGSTMVLIDLVRDGELIIRNQEVPYGKRNQRQSTDVKEGLKLLRAYDLDHALETFEQGLHNEPQNADLHFYKACAHSLLEQSDQAFYHLDQAIQHGFTDRQQVLTEDALAYIRIQEEFDAFAKRHGLKAH